MPAEDNKSETKSPLPQGDGSRTATATPMDVNIVMRCAMKGTPQRFIRCFEDEEDQFHETVADMLNERVEDGKSPLDMASVLGRIEMVKELINRGAEINSVTSKGYSALHNAAAWGKCDCVKVLVENGADLQQKTAHGERAREISLRYNQMECVDYLDWAEAKQALRQAIQMMKDTLTDPEKIQGKLTRDERNTTNNICSEKWEWIENTSDATTQDFISQKQMFDEAVSVIWQKLSEPVPEKK